MTLSAMAHCEFAASVDMTRQPNPTARRTSADERLAGATWNSCPMIQVEADALSRVKDAALSRAPISLGIRRTASPAPVL